MRRAKKVYYNVVSLGVVRVNCERLLLFQSTVNLVGSLVVPLFRARRFRTRGPQHSRKSLLWNPRLSCTRRRPYLKSLIGATPPEIQ